MFEGVGLGWVGWEVGGVYIYELRNDVKLRRIRLYRADEPDYTP